MAAGSALDDVRIYNRALSSIEVSALALGNMPGAASRTIRSTGIGDQRRLRPSVGNVIGTGALSISGNWLNYGGTNTATAA